MSYRWESSQTSSRRCFFFFDQPSDGCLIVVMSLVGRVACDLPVNRGDFGSATRDDMGWILWPHDGDLTRDG